MTERREGAYQVFEDSPLVSDRPRNPHNFFHGIRHNGLIASSRLSTFLCASCNGTTKRRAQAVHQTSPLGFRSFVFDLATSLPRTRPVVGACACFGFAARCCTQWPLEGDPKSQQKAGSWWMQSGQGISRPTRGDEGTCIPTKSNTSPTRSFVLSDRR